ncbi:MAG TPA: YbaB/EbfC family nucleoid-associated protein [Micromonosporaceae bacterium]
MVEPTDVTAMNDDAELVARRMREVSDTLTAGLADASATTQEVTSADGDVTVIANGTPRVVAVRLDPRAMRMDPAALADLLTQTLNAALRSARQASQAALLEGLDPTLRADMAAGLAQTERYASGRGDNASGSHGDVDD